MPSLKPSTFKQSIEGRKRMGEVAIPGQYKDTSSVSVRKFAWSKVFLTSAVKKLQARIIPPLAGCIPST